MMAVTLTFEQLVRSCRLYNRVPTAKPDTPTTVKLRPAYGSLASVRDGRIDDRLSTTDRLRTASASHDIPTVAHRSGLIL